MHCGHIGGRYSVLIGSWRRGGRGIKDVDLLQLAAAPGVLPWRSVGRTRRREAARSRHACSCSSSL